MVDRAITGPSPSSHVVGRERELAVLSEFLVALTVGPARLALLGRAGAGKSTLLDVVIGCGRRDDMTVVALRPNDAEAKVLNAGLRDLVVQLGDVHSAGLSHPQQRALAQAIEFATTSDDEVDANPLALRAAVVALLESAAARSPVLIAVDDLAWLDSSSAELLAYAVARVRGRVGVAVTVRSVTTVPPGWADLVTDDVVVPVDALTDSAVRSIVRSIGSRLDPSDVEHVVRLAEGNAFYATQLARRAVSGRVWEGPIDELIAERLAALEPATLDVLRVASTSSTPTLSVVRHVLDSPSDLEALVDVAEDAGLIAMRGSTIVFAHPIIRHEAAASMPPSTRRHIHRRLAEIALDPAERATHLALGSIDADHTVLAALDDAAAHAAQRGAPGNAAEFLELAAHLDPHDGPSRVVLAAEHRLTVGDLSRCRQLIDPLLASHRSDMASPSTTATSSQPPDWLVRAVAVLATVSLLEGDLVNACHGFQRVTDIATDPTSRASALLSLTFALTNTGQVAAARAVIDEVEAHPLDVGPSLGAAVHATAVMVRFLSGDDLDWDRLERAAAVPADSSSRYVPPTSHPLLVSTILLHLAGRFTDAVDVCEALRSELRERGDEAALALVDFWVAWIWGGLGDFDTLDELVAESRERGRAFGTPARMAASLTASATLAAWRGDRDRCLSDVDQALRALGPMSPPAVWAINAAGLAEIGCGNHSAALAWFEPLLVVTEAMGLSQPCAAWWTPELVEVLTEVGRADEARALLARYDVSGFGKLAHDARAVVLRCEALVAVAEGDSMTADRLFSEALDAHCLGDSLVSLARTQLHYGALLRRMGQRAAAAEVLGAAHMVFVDKAMGGFAARAKAEIGRLGVRSRGDAPLTPSEREVAQLISEGLTNKQISARLHASTKTVEAHLTHIYRKLGLKSRSELAAAVVRNPSLVGNGSANEDVALTLP